MCDATDRNVLEYENYSRISHLNQSTKRIKIGARGEPEQEGEEVGGGELGSKKAEAKK